MKVRYASPHGVAFLTLRDISLPAFQNWALGDERDVDGISVSFPINGERVMMPLAEALFRHGAAFVDAKTGKNPLLTCAHCNGDAFEIHVPHHLTGDEIRFVNKHGDRLCVACFLRENPQYIVNFRQRGHADAVHAATHTPPEAVAQEEIADDDDV